MLRHMTDDAGGIVHLSVNGRLTFDDYQQSMPEVIEKFKSKSLNKLLLQIEALDAPNEYVDPDLAFSTINDLKSYIQKMALVAPSHLLGDLHLFLEIVRNGGKPAEHFPDVQAAKAWLLE